MPAAAVTYTPTNSITISEAGTYEINYMAVASVALGTTLTVAVRVNEDNLSAATITRLLAVGVESPFSGSIIVNLPAGAVIDMALSELLAVGVTLGSGVNAVLTVKKLDA